MVEPRQPTMQWWFVVWLRRLPPIMRCVVVSQFLIHLTQFRIAQKMEIDRTDNYSHLFRDNIFFICRRSEIFQTKDQIESKAFSVFPLKVQRISFMTLIWPWSSVWIGNADAITHVIEKINKIVIKSLTVNRSIGKPKMWLNVHAWVYN